MSCNVQGNTSEENTSSLKVCQFIYETNTRMQVQLRRPMGQVPDPTFPQTSRFPPDFLSGAALKFSVFPSQKQPLGPV